MLSLLYFAFALNIFQTVTAIPAAVTTSTRLTTVTSCSCTSKSTSKTHTSTFTISGSSSCTAKHITPTCKATTSTIKTTITIPSTSTKRTSTTSSTHSSSTSTSKSSSKTSTTHSTTTTTSKSSTITSSTATPSVNSGHRGLAYNSPPLTLPFSLSSPLSKVSWSYNWYSLPYTIGQPTSGYNPALNFVPMLWSAASDLTSVWSANVHSSISTYKTTAVLAFNEPDGCGGGSACMNVSAAVAGYKKWMDPLAGTVRLGAPAVTNGEGATMGLSYLKDFLGNCTGCTIDFVPIHWYGDGGNVAGFESYVSQAYSAGGGRPLWVTEVGVTSGDAEAFLEGVAGWLDGSAMVERWAWFMDQPGNLINANGSGLSVMGVGYNGGW